jgi:tetratricopeptide (TPR) repeat protein
MRTLKAALKIKRRALGEDHVDVAGTLQNIGNVHRNQGKNAEALEMLGMALAIYDRALGIDNVKRAFVYYKIALDAGRSGDVAGALEGARESVRIYTT